jgi:hypothetical protein
MFHKSDKVATARCSEKLHQIALGVVSKLAKKGTGLYLIDIQEGTPS